MISFGFERNPLSFEVIPSIGIIFSKPSLGFFVDFLDFNLILELNPVQKECPPIEDLVRLDRQWTGLGVYQHKGFVYLTPKLSLSVSNASSAYWVLSLSFLEYTINISFVFS